jgi:hypothetical protein
MRFGRFSWVICCLLLVEIPARPQQAPVSGAPATQDKQAVTLLQASLSALLASTAAPPSTIVASGTATPLLDSAALAYSVRVHVKGTDEFRWEEDLPGGTTAVVIHGQNAQSQLGSTGTPLMPWEFRGKRLENFPILLLAQWLTSNKTRLQFVGLEAVEGQSLNHISIVDLSQRTRLLNPWHRDGNRGQYELYLDPATSLPVRLRHYEETSDTHFYSLLPVDIVYSDFRVTAGSVFPFALTRYVGGRKIATLQLQSIQPNGAVSDQEFQIW